MKLLTILLFLLNAPSKNSFFENTLTTPENKPFSFSHLKNYKATVVIFLLTDCPASQSYTLTLNKLNEKYNKQRICFLGVFPGTYSSTAEIISFRKTYHLNFELLSDRSMKLASYLNATVAPEAFLIGKDGNIKYSGRIDDWIYALGKKRKVITSHDLDHAIDAYIHGKEIKIRKTNAIGCILQ